MSYWWIWEMGKQSIQPEKVYCLKKRDCRRRGSSAVFGKAGKIGGKFHAFYRNRKEIAELWLKIIIPRKAFRESEFIILSCADRVRIASGVRFSWLLKLRISSAIHWFTSSSFKLAYVTIKMASRSATVTKKEISQIMKQAVPEIPEEGDEF